MAQKPSLAQSPSPNPHILMPAWVMMAGISDKCGHVELPSYPDRVEGSFFFADLVSVFAHPRLLLQRLQRLQSAVVVELAGGGWMVGAQKHNHLFTTEQ